MNRELLGSERVSDHRRIHVWEEGWSAQSVSSCGGRREGRKEGKERVKGKMDGRVVEKTVGLRSGQSRRERRAQGTRQAELCNADASFFQMGVGTF